MTKVYDILIEEARRRKRDLEERTWIRVGTALCGQATGALEVAQALRVEVARQGLDAKVSEVGCLGLCYAEPLVEIQFPGGPRMFYQQVTTETLPPLTEAHLVDTSLPMATLGEPVLAGVSSLYDLPMMKVLIFHSPPMGRIWIKPS